MILTIDCETIPGQAPWIHEETKDWAEYHAMPANLTTPEPKSYSGAKLQAWKDSRDAGIEAWYTTALPKLMDEHVHKQCLDAATGEIICIALKIDDRETFVYRGTEHQILSDFFEQVLTLSKRKNIIFAGHNIIGFDLGYIARRAWANGLTIPE